jgi:hypothetical protein
MASPFTEELAKRLRTEANEHAKTAFVRPTDLDRAEMMNAMLDGIIIYVDLLVEKKREANVGKNRV